MDGSLFLRALLTGIFCYLGAIESPWLFGMSGGFYVVGRPLVAGFLVGMAFGDIKAGVLCGLAVQAVFIANLSTGGATNSEITYAAYGGIGTSGCSYSSDFNRSDLWTHILQYTNGSIFILEYASTECG